MYHNKIRRTQSADGIKTLRTGCVCMTRVINVEEALYVCLDGGVCHSTIVAYPIRVWACRYIF